EIDIVWMITYHFIFSLVVMDNYKNAPQYLYGLTPPQMGMFITEDNPIRQQSESVTDDYFLFLLLHPQFTVHLK
ncbi:endopeptidase Clp, partial [Sarracenia purpurea var. burkii]